MFRLGGYVVSHPVAFHSVIDDNKQAIAVAVSSSSLPIPPSSGYTAIGLGVASILSVVVKYKLVPPKYHAFVPCVLL